MNNAESKYYRTAVRMDQALLKLMGEKDYSYITVKEICQRAEVNRTTFYLHYEGISDLLEETLAYASKNFSNYFQQTGYDFPASFSDKDSYDHIPLDKLLISYLQFVRSNRSAILAAYNNPTVMNVDVWMNFIDRHVMEPIMKQFRIPEEERIYRASYYRQGSQAIVRTWMELGCTTPVEDISRIIMRCVSSDRNYQEKWEEKNHE